MKYTYGIPFLDDEEDTNDTIRVVLLIIMLISFIVGIILFAVGHTQELQTLKFISYGFFVSVGLCFMTLISLCDEM